MKKINICLAHVPTGFCDDVNNNAFCAWDGGDCCASPTQAKDNQFGFCQACACLDCADKDFRTCVVAGKRGKCAGASATTAAATTTRSSMRARTTTTTTTSTTTTAAGKRTRSTATTPATATTRAASTTETTTVASPPRDRCVRVAKGECGSAKHKGDGE